MENNENQYNTSFNPIPPAEYEQPTKHSGLGIASFVIGVIAVLLVIIGIAVAASTASNLTNDQALLDELLNLSENTQNQTELGEQILENEEFSSIIYTFIGAAVLLFGAVGLSLLGGIFGLISVFAKNKRKVFGVIGLVLNLIIFVGAIGFFFVGIAGLAAV